MDSNEALGINNARQQIKLVKSLRSIRERQSIPLEQVAECMRSDGLDFVKSAGFVAEFELGGMNFSAALLRSYAKAVGAELTMQAQLPKTKTHSEVLAATLVRPAKSWGPRKNHNASAKRDNLLAIAGQGK